MIMIQSKPDGESNFTFDIATTENKTQLSDWVKSTLSNCETYFHHWLILTFQIWSKGELDQNLGALLEGVGYFVYTFDS